MNWRHGLAFVLALAGSQAAHALPVPVYNGITVNGQATVNGPVTVTGNFEALGGGQLAGTFVGPLTIGPVTPELTLTTQAGLSGLPAVTGTFAYVTDCPNGNQSGGGSTGCPAFRDSGGTWRLMSTPSNLSITIGGQAVTLGGATANQGNGSLIQLAGTGAKVAGNAAVYDAAGNLVDSGVVPSGGTGGGGTVAPGLQGSIPSYLNAGTSSTVGPLPIVNNAVLATNASGLAGEVTTLPTGLTIPSATLPNPTLTGSISIGTASYTGKQTFLASVSSSAGLNIPAGVAPSAPAVGDEWATASGLFYRASTGPTTQGPFLYQVTTSGPITGGGVGPSLALACATCATTTSGGALTATAPITISSAGLIALGTIPKPIVWLADSTTIVHNDTYSLMQSPWTLATPVQKIRYHTGGTGTPSFVLTLNTCTGQSGGAYTGCTVVPGCSGISVTSSTDNTTTCTGGSVVPAGQYLTMVITGATGSPSSAWVQTTVAGPAS